MRNVFGYLNKALLLSGLVLAWNGSMALGDSTDSNSMSQGGFAKAVSQAKGVVLRVEINAEGQENRESATMRVNTSQEQVTTADEVQTAFANGLSSDAQPQVSSIDMARDSNTFGWWHYRHNGWAQPYYYYYNYTPVYYNYGYSYNFYNPYYYNVWSYPYSYRYYYYYGY
jgi:hypothetical protein